MFEKILYPTDFSDVANKAVPYVERLHRAGARTVTILHVIDSRGLDLISYDPSEYRRAKEALSRLAQENMSFVARRLEREGLVVKTLIKTGNPAGQILKTALQEGTDVIVIGSHGKSNLAEIIIGSVSERVVRNAACPVLVVKR